ncbi:MAG: leucine-rich repeat protein [Acutalibacteraceae bacterium]
MKKILKKSLAFILALTMVFGAAPLAGLVGLELPEIGEIFAEKAEAATYGVLSYEITDGEVTITDCDESASGELVIPETIEGYPVLSIKTLAFNGIDISSVTIPKSVENIGTHAFAGCKNLKFITVDENNKYFTNDEYGALLSKDKTYLIQYPTGNMSTSYIIPAEVENIVYAFAGCSNLAEIYVDEKNQYFSSDEYGVLFNKNKTMLVQYPIGSPKKEYSIPNSVINISLYAFQQCSKLENVIISNNITRIGDYSFSFCSGLTSVTIGNGVNNIDYNAFYKCTSLTDVYYTGTDEQWNAISILSGNSCLTNANIHFNYAPTVHEHSFTSSVTKGATCTEDGEKTFTCECKYSYTEVIPAKGHTAGAWEVVEEPTTQKEGKKVRKCTECGAEVEQAVVPKLTEEPVIDDEIVNTPSTSSISYGDSIVLHVDSSKIPEGGYVEWTASNGNFGMSVSADGTTCTVSPKSSGKTVFTATVYDKDGNVISTDTQEMTAKAGLWQKIVAFFKKIFGLTKTIPEAVKGIF